MPAVADDPLLPRLLALRDEVRLFLDGYTSRSAAQDGMALARLKRALEVADGEGGDDSGEGDS